MMKKIMACLLAGVCLLAAGCGSDSTPKQELNIFSWADNFSPEVLSDFEKKYNCKINYDVFANNEELLAKIQAGGAQYDVIQPSDYMVATMTKLDLLEDMDRSKMPNVDALIPALQAPPYDPTGRHSVVYTWGVTGIAYNKKYVKETPTSWQDLWKDEYTGRVILLNDSREVLGMALKKQGHSVNAKRADEVYDAVRDLRMLSPKLLAYDTDTIKQKFIAEDAWIGTMWSGDAAFAHYDNPNISFVVPKEGAVIWADTLAIPKGAKNKALAEEFINYLYDPEVCKVNYEYIGYNDPRADAETYHSEEYNGNEILKTARDYITKGEWILDIGDALRYYDRAWTELKTGK
ncbi:putrescine ABC transporter, periplasmic spermidine [Veillonellaceae bacterium DNF00626]|nr:putrescine ABC transporter, periplasmic spermidine [Veillonellaceae bacterium DNF00626]